MTRSTRATPAGVPRSKVPLTREREQYLLWQIDKMIAVVKAARETTEFYRIHNDTVRPRKLAELLWTLRDEIKNYDETFTNPTKGSTHEQAS